MPFFFSSSYPFSFTSLLPSIKNKNVNCDYPVASSVPSTLSSTSTNVSSGISEAYPEQLYRVPLNPIMDEKLEYKAYKWGSEELNKSRMYGNNSYDEEMDNYNGKAIEKPWPVEAATFHKNEHPESDRINTQYSNMINDYIPKDGYTEGGGKGGRPTFETTWEKLLAYHHGIYKPYAYGEVKSADDIIIAVNNFSEKVHEDDPKNACKYLMIEEYKCLQAHQADLNIEKAASSCWKWEDEWQKCMWDSHKFNMGYNFIEGRTHKKHKPYIAAPDYQFS